MIVAVCFITIPHNFSSCSEMNCQHVKEIYVPEIVDVCTKDVPVFIEDINKNKILVFLTELGSLKPVSEEVSCSNNIESFILNDFIINRLNKKVSIENHQIKKNNVTQFNQVTSQVVQQQPILQEVSKVSARLCESIECFYDKYVDKNERVKMIRDFFEVLIWLVLFFYCIYKAKDTPAALKNFFLFLSKKRGDKRQAENSIQAQNDDEKFSIKVIPTSDHINEVVKLTRETAKNDQETSQSSFQEVSPVFLKLNSDKNFDQNIISQKSCSCAKGCVYGCACKNNHKQKCNINCSCKFLMNCKNF